MIPNRLILRETNSPFVTPYEDTNQNSVLSRKQLDGNFVYLKGEVIYSADTIDDNLVLMKHNGNNLTLPLSGLTGGSSEQDNKFRFIDLGNWMAGGRGLGEVDIDAAFITGLDYLLDNTSITVNDDELIIFKISVTVYGAFNTEQRKYYFKNLTGKGDYDPLSNSMTASDLEIAYKEIIANTPDDVINSPNVNLMNLGTLPDADYINYINNSGPYDLTDSTKIHYFRFDYNGVDYIYVFDPNMSTYGYDIYGSGFSQFDSDDLTLFYDSSLPVINDDETVFSGTYETLQSLASTNQLIVGKKYIMTDYKTKYIINGSDSSTRQQIHEVIGSAGNYTQFVDVPSTIAANGDVVTVVYAPTGSTVVSGQTLTITDYFNSGFIRFSPTLNGAANIGVQLKFEKQRYTNIPNDIIINDINGKPVIKPSGVLNTEVHDGLPYMSMTGDENPEPITEQIVLTAIDVDTFSQNAESLTFIGDTLIYDFNDNVINDDNGYFVDNKNGTILKRTNLGNTISVNKDWRVQRYRRYRMDDYNWNQYLLKKELSALSGTSGSTIYKISTVNYCTNNNTTLTNEHRYIVSEPYISGFYIDFAKNVENPFISGTTTAPTVSIGSRLSTLEHTTEYSVNMSLPISGFSGTTLGRDLHIFPIVSGEPSSMVTTFKVKNLTNSVFTTNSQRYGASQNIFVDSEYGNIFNTSVMTGPTIINTNDIDKFNCLEFLSLKNDGKITNINILGYHSIENKGLLTNVTFGQGYIGSSVNEYSEYTIRDTSIITDTIFGSNRTDRFTLDLKTSRSLIINRTAAYSHFGGNLYLTLYKNFGNIYGCTFELDTFVNQIPAKGYYGYVYDFNTALNDIRVNNFITNKNLIYQSIDGSFVVSYTTVATVA